MDNLLDRRVTPVESLLCVPGSFYSLRYEDNIVLKIIFYIKEKVKLNVPRIKESRVVGFVSGGPE